MKQQRLGSRVEEIEKRRRVKETKRGSLLAMMPASWKMERSRGG